MSKEKLRKVLFVEYVDMPHDLIERLKGYGDITNGAFVLIASTADVPKTIGSSFRELYTGIAEKNGCSLDEVLVDNMYSYIQLWVEDSFDSSVVNDADCIMINVSW